MPFSLLPKDRMFFDLFSRHADNALQAAQTLQRLLGDFTDVESKARTLHDLEHVGDELTHDIIKRVNQRFVTPLDREDIMGLAARIDDVTDVCYDASEMLSLYRVRRIRLMANQQVSVLVSAAAELVTMLKNLEGLQGLEPHWIKVHSLENQGDQLMRDALLDLFANEPDPVEVVKWKDIHGLIEVAIDRCEDVANIVEMIVVKHK